MKKRYEPREIEDKWQKYWLRSEIYEIAYKFDKDDGKHLPFIIDTPPPFTSGVLHVGHTYWNIINDTVARYKRLRGFNVLLPQGWDCQGLPTELKVQNIWKIPKTDRELFRQKCVEWTQNMIKSMKETMIKIGYRPDWEQFEYRTIDSSYQRNVQLSLINLYHRDFIYRDAFPIHWCPNCETALAQAELGYVSEVSHLFYIKFAFRNEQIEIATTRPELLSACQALAVNPEDTRYSQLVGKTVTIPLFHREVPVLADDAVDIEFGTGVVMVCTFGDVQDIKWQQKYELPISKVVDEHGRIVNSGKYNGLKIMEARDAVVKDLVSLGLVSKTNKISHKVLCHTERADCMSPVEFLVKTQFFIKIKPFKNEVIKACETMSWTPPHILQRLIDWVNSIEWDWLISRQRIYGTPLPFWYCEECNEIIPASEKQLPVNPERIKPPVKKCPKCECQKIKPTSDVCDCWVDSSITPLIISSFFDDCEQFKRFYPTSVRQQGHDIIRTWLVYTTHRCLILTGKPPFMEVLVNGHILGPDGHKMSKSKGNIINLEDKFEEFGADSLRQALLSLTIGSDFPFNWEAVKYNKNFLQKYWSVSRFAYRFIKDYKSDVNFEDFTLLDKWILAKLFETIDTVKQAFDEYKFHIVLDAIQNFIWHDFCDQYVETVKNRLYNRLNEENYRAAQYTLHTVLWNINIIFSPICPHITEEIYSLLFDGTQASVHAERWPSIIRLAIDTESKDEGNVVIEMIAQIRNQKSKLRIPLNVEVDSVEIIAPNQMILLLRKVENDLKRILFIKKIEFKKGKEIVINIQEK